MPYMVTFTINIPQMLAYIPYMDPMGYLIPIIPLLMLYWLLKMAISSGSRRSPIDDLLNIKFRG